MIGIGHPSPVAGRLARCATGLSLMLAAGLPAAARAQSPTWQYGAVLDLSLASRPLALGARSRGPQLGHSDLSASGPITPWLRAQLTATVATHEHEGRREFERGIEEAWVETTRLPGGLQLRAGRFASQIGYLNAQHPHADDFSERPLLYRAFYGGHWNDDGLRLNWTAPTPWYLMLGIEALRGRRLVEEALEPARSLGVVTATLKLGADIGWSQSWQLGLSHVHNRREALAEDGHGHGAETGHAHDPAHDHAHGARYSGRRTWMIDGTWKWAPGGNNRQQQLRLGFEAARISGVNRFAAARDRHEANALWAVWRFHPTWETGARADWLRVRQPHGEHFHWGLLRETSLMLAWKPTHQQSLRLQLTQQRDAVGIDGAARRAVQLQYVLAFGAHGAHAY